MRSESRYYLGLDVGSLSCDAVIVNDRGETIGFGVVPTGAQNRVAIERVRQRAIVAARLNPGQVQAVVTTGYGRDRVDDRLAAVTEITCHARGIRQLVPDADLLIDIGGQDSKAIRFDAAGQVEEFSMNDKCAAGTGRFLEAMARALEVPLSEMARLDGQAVDEISISAMCTVFAESEVVSLLADGTDRANVARGLHRAVASRTHALVKRVAPRLDGLKVAMSGGVARNQGVVRALCEQLKCEIHLPPEPDIVGALGAALIARDRGQLKKS